MDMIIVAALVYYTSIRPGTKTGDPVVTDNRALKYDPNGMIMYKQCDEYNHLRRKAKRQDVSTEVQPLHKGPLPIKRSQYQQPQY
ncbi:hypothetical protein MAR_020878 [Mya arenaria]|uniref:Uncharacterized protein n=1 Tax=Mya arenaria TaxID=6604 RepID=A0ABY7EAS0_MYAAR|nr:hypothetical protein MAR_020878 [Mya arenaria]